MPLFVRDGAIIPMLLRDVRTLCDANYVNNPSVATMDGSWLLQIYPAEVSAFSVFDGTQINCQGSPSSSTVTVTSQPRRLTLRILAQQPESSLRDGVPYRLSLPGSPTRSDFDSTHNWLSRCCICARGWDHHGPVHTG